MRLTRLTASVAVTLALAGTVTACAAPQMAPKLELRAASARLDGPQGGVTLSFTGDLDALTDAVAVYSKHEKLAALKADDKLVIEKLFGSSVTVRYDEGHDGTADDKLAFSATVAGIEGADARYIGSTLYFKAPVEDIAVQFGMDRATLRSAAARPGIQPGVAAVLRGKWVAIDGSKAAATAQSALGSSYEVGKALGEAVRNKLSEVQLTMIRTGIRDLLSKAAITRDKDDQTHLVATVTRKDVAATAQTLLTALSPAVGKKLGEDAPGATGKDITVDIWVKNGVITGAELNLVPLLGGTHGRAALRLVPTPAAPITAPAGATPLKPGN